MGRKGGLRGKKDERRAGLERGGTANGSRALIGSSGTAREKGRKWTAAGHWKETEQWLHAAARTGERLVHLDESPPPQPGQRSGKCGDLFLQPLYTRRGAKFTAWRHMTANFWPVSHSQLLTGTERSHHLPPYPLPPPPPPHGCRLSTLASPFPPRLYIRLR